MELKDLSNDFSKGVLKVICTDFETSGTGFFISDEEKTRQVLDLASKIQIPLLIGANTEKIDLSLDFTITLIGRFFRWLHTVVLMLFSMV